MKRQILTLAALVITALALVPFVLADGPDDRAASDGRIYVVSQGLYFDVVALGDLPQQGRFQKLEMGPDGAYTQYGPGDAGYLGGRWWVDVNGDNIQNEGDRFFLCPLIGPGHSHS